jgi:hypothetical protein
MKTFFLLLLLTNIVFAMLQWLMPYEQVFSYSRQVAAAEQLRLVDEAESQAAIQIEQRDQQEFIDELPMTEEVPAVKLCYTLGPFKDKKLVQEVLQNFKQNNLAVSSRASVEKEYLGVMVFIDGHETRKQATSTAQSLADKGVRDYMIVNEEDKTHALSLGVFGLKKNADRRMERIAALGYKVNSEARYRNRTIYWLDYDEIENESLQRLVDKLKIDQGISRISRQCG